MIIRRTNFCVYLHRVRRLDLHQLHFLLLEAHARSCVVLPYHSSLKKAKQFEVLGELYHRGLISKQILLEVSDNVQSVHDLNKQRRSEEPLELLDHVPLKYQLLLLRRVFGPDFHYNSFFRDLDISFVIHLLKTHKTLRLNPGEQVYTAQMPATNCTLISSSIFDPRRPRELPDFTQHLFQVIHKG